MGCIAKVFFYGWPPSTSSMPELPCEDPPCKHYGKIGTFPFSSCLMVSDVVLFRAIRVLEILISFRACFPLESFQLSKHLTALQLNVQICRVEYLPQLR